MIAETDRIGAAYLGRRPRARARGRLASGRSRRPASRRSSSRTRSRPATTRRRTPSTSSRAGGAIMVRELDLDDVPELVRSLLDDPARLARMGEAMLARGAAGRRRRDRRRAASSSRPDDGRRLWFVGIGGAGLSAYAQLARAWGAEVGGWDRVAHAVPRRRSTDVPVEISPEPVVPDGLGGGRLVRVPGRAGARAAASSSRELVAAASVDRRRRHRTARGRPRR